MHTRTYVRYTELFRWPLALAALALLAGAVARGSTRPTAMNAVSFDYLWLLPLVVVLPVLAAWFVRSSHRRRKGRLERLGSLDIVRRLMPSGALVPPGWRMARLGAAVALRSGRRGSSMGRRAQRDSRSNGIDMVLALDASLSMLATDEHPDDRLERNGEEVRRLLALSPNDRIGLLAFAGRSYMCSHQSTVDQGALELFLDKLDPSPVGQARSSVARTIHPAVDLSCLSRRSGADKALIVMSDWEAFVCGHYYRGGSKARGYRRCERGDRWGLGRRLGRRGSRSRTSTAAPPSNATRERPNRGDPIPPRDPESGRRCRPRNRDRKRRHRQRGGVSRSAGWLYSVATRARHPRRRTGRLVFNGSFSRRCCSSSSTR